MQTHKFSSKKDIKKLLRSILQAGILLWLVYIIITALFSFQQYKAYDLAAPTDKDNGFIAVSYFGVDRTGSNTLITEKRLEEHLKALKDWGYVTITQQDVMDYYKKGKKLPEKSLFLMFEDGRRDTAIFSQKVMEKYNYKATMLTYADKFEKKDMKFLMPDELLALEDSTFWELGTNGYRLEYINVFDRHKNYLGELDTLEFGMVAPYLDRNYNHYLMDYIRDEYGIPKESYKEMKKRITGDYKKIEDIYTKRIGKIPNMYILMHSNTGQYGTNDKVSATNGQSIQELFKMNFNREGYSLNKKDSSIYDLTRIQPQAYWPTNHLLMRIWDDTKQEVKFITGDLDKAKAWEKVEGQAEFTEDVITLTSMPKGNGLLRLKDSKDFKDLKLSVSLEGNQLGSQSVYIRADEALENYVSIQLKNNTLNVNEKLQGKEKVLFSLNLDEHDGIIKQSMDENKKQAEIEELKMERKYANDVKETANVSLRMQDKTNTEVYQAPLELKKRGNRLLEISIKGDNLDISIDKKVAASHLKLSNFSNGYVYIESAWSENGYSQRNLTDDVYDGVFKSVVITTDKNEETKILFDNRLTGFSKLIYKTKETRENIINWFIRTL